MKNIGLIPRSRLQFLPDDLKKVHEYCFFLHDECLRMLKEYESGKAHIVQISLDKSKSLEFEKIANKSNALEALDALGYKEERKRVAINTITIAMVADCLNHLYESFRCFEKRKYVVGFNTLRKPLLDSLLYLSWAYCKEDEFYYDFRNDSERLSQKRLGIIRNEILRESLKLTGLDSLIAVGEIENILFSKTNKFGLHLYFQHSVHLITVKHLELKTSEENFNFIFKSPIDDDVYYDLYNHLPVVMLYLSHVIQGLFNRMKKMDDGAFNAFKFRSTYGYLLLCNHNEVSESNRGRESISKELSNLVCSECNIQVKLSEYNLARVLLTDSYKCQSCKKIIDYPFSWAF